VITYPLTMPSQPEFKTVGWMGRTASGFGESPFSFAQQVQLSTGEAWSLEIELPPMRRPLAAPWAAFLLALRGTYGYFRLPVDPSARRPQGAVTGNPVADTAGSPTVNYARATELHVRSLPTLGSPPVGVSNVYKTGDFISYDAGTERLHMVLQDVASDAQGRATLDIWPRLREDVPDGTIIVHNDCAGTFRLATNIVEWSLVPALIHGFSFRVIEKLP
jgi:hypothetical protein